MQVNHAHPVEIAVTIRGSQFVQMRHLKLQNNHLDVLPESIGELPNLQRLGPAI